MFVLPAEDLECDEPEVTDFQQNLEREGDSRANRAKQRRASRDDECRQHHGEESRRSAGALELSGKVAMAFRGRAPVCDSQRRKILDIELAINELHVPYLRQFPIGTNPNFAIPPRAAPRLPGRQSTERKSACCACLLRAIRCGGDLASQGGAAGDIRCSLRSPCRDRPGLYEGCSRIARIGAGRGRRESRSRGEAQSGGCRRWRSRESLLCTGYCVPSTVRHILYETYCATYSKSCQEKSSSFSHFSLGIVPPAVEGLVESVSQAAESRQRGVEEQRRPSVPRFSPYVRF